MKAQSSESILYDYYNPQARASVPQLALSFNETIAPSFAGKLVHSWCTLACQ